MILVEGMRLYRCHRGGWSPHWLEEMHRESLGDSVALSNFLVKYVVGGDGHARLFVVVVVSLETYSVYRACCGHVIKPDNCEAL